MTKIVFFLIKQIYNFTNIPCSGLLHPGVKGGNLVIDSLSEQRRLRVSCLLTVASLYVTKVYPVRQIQGDRLQVSSFF